MQTIAEITSAPNTPAPLWRRLFAMVYDGFLLMAIALGYTALHLGIKVWIFGTSFVKALPAGKAGDPFLFLGVIISIVAFYFWFWTRNGQTLGMQSWRLRVEQPSGDLINLKQSLLRLLVAPLSLVCFGIGYGWCLFGEKKTWQDIASGTRVIVLPKK